MDDLISRAIALSAIDFERKVLIEQGRLGAEHIVVHHARRLIEDLPAVDTAPVVRCKDCIYWKSDMLTHFWKPCDVVSTDKDWYCPCGKRR